MFGTLEKMKEYGTMLLVHAESARVLDELIARHHTPELMANYGARLHPMTRPNFIEAEAIQRAFFDVINGEVPDTHGWLTYVYADEAPFRKERGAVGARG